MIRPLLMTCGSRGDVEPMFALACALAERGDVEEVTLLIPSDQAELSPKKQKVCVKTYAFNIADAWKYFPTFSGEADPAVFDGKAELGVLGALIRGMILPIAEQLISAVRDSNPNILVSGAMTMCVAHMAAQLLEIPFAWLQFQPMVPSAYYPHIMLHSSDAAKAMDALLRGEDTRDDANFDTHVQSVQLIFDPIRDDINSTRQRINSSLKPMNIQDVVDLYSGKKEQGLHLLLNVPSSIAPRTPDMGDTVHLVGSVAASYIPPNWSPPEDLIQFIQAGPKPAVISLGSMDSQGAGSELTTSLVTGLRNAGIKRIVLLPGHANLGADGIPSHIIEDVYIAQCNIQLAWLLLRCQVFVSHCGAGSVSAAVVAGVPIVAIPVVSDQFFFAELIERRLLGAKLQSVGLPNVTTEGIEKAAIRARTSEVLQAVSICRHQCAIAKEGAERAANVVAYIASY